MQVPSSLLDIYEINLSDLLKKYCEEALKKAYPEMAAEIDPSWIEITQATQEQFGDYQCNSAMKLAKILGEPPRGIAQKIAAFVFEMGAVHSLFSNSSENAIAGPGFINFKFNPIFIAKRLNKQLRDPRLGVPQPLTPKKVVIDFSSPNTAKEMHVGHLRSTIIGDSIARLLEFMGHEVIRLNHIGDWGTQFGMLIAYLKIVFPDITHTHPPDVPLTALANWYRESKKRFDEDPEFKKQSQLEVVALQSGNEDSKRAWMHICEISRKAYKEIYELLDIAIEERGESFYHDQLADVIKELKEKKLLSISNGATCLYLEGFTNRDNEPLPLILQKSDGGFNYATTDMAALRHRVRDEKANWLIYVTDAGQSLHFEMIFEAAQKAGFYDPNKIRIDHVPFGLVLKPDGKKFKTRSGDTERLVDLIYTAIDKAKEKLLERDPNMPATELEKSAHILGINAIKYSDLACHRISDYIFSYDKMLKFEGNTAAFLLYAYVRVQSIKRKLDMQESVLLEKDFSFSTAEKIPADEFKTEIALGLLICQFNEVLEGCARELLPNRLTDYLYRLAEKFHAFFHQCRVENPNDLTTQNNRLLLCEATARVLHQGFLILGLKPLERM